MPVHVVHQVMARLRADLKVDQLKRHQRVDDEMGDVIDGLLQTRLHGHAERYGQHDGDVKGADEDQHKVQALQKQSQSSGYVLEWAVPGEDGGQLQGLARASHEVEVRAGLVVVRRHGVAD